MVINQSKWLLSIFKCVMLGIRDQNIISKMINNPYNFFDKCSIRIFIFAFGLFMYFKNHKPWHNRTINLIASSTFGVYLIHANYIINNYLWNVWFDTSTIQNQIYIILFSVLSILIVYIICTFIDLARQITIEKLFLKLINRICKYKILNI